MRYVVMWFEDRPDDHGDGVRCWHIEWQGNDDPAHYVERTKKMRGNAKLIDTQLL